MIGFVFDLQRHKGGTTVTNTSTYTPTEYEVQLQKAQADYADAVAPNALWLNDVGRALLQNSIGAVQVDYNGLNNTAQSQIANQLGQLSSLPASNTAAANAVIETLGNISNQYGQAANNNYSRLQGLADKYTSTANTTNDAIAALANKLGTVTNKINSGIAQIAPQYGESANTTNKNLGTAASQFGSIANAANGALNGLIGTNATATTGANADLDEYIRANKNAWGISDNSLYNLGNGTLPSAYLQNMSDAIRTGVNRTVGNAINNLAQRGVINSSVTTGALNDIESNVADTMAQNYLNNINTVGNLANQRLSNALTTDRENAAMTAQQLNNVLANTDRAGNIIQQQYNNGANSLSNQVNIYNQQNANTQNALAAMQGNLQQQYSNAANTAGVQGNMVQQQYNNATNSLGNVGNIYDTQYGQLTNALGNQAQLAQQQFTNRLGANESNAGIYNQTLAGASLPTTQAAAAQEAAQHPALSAWNASIGLNGTTTGALAAAAGKGTTTSTQTQSGGGGFLSGLLGTAASIGAGLFCFVAGTKVRMGDGTEKNIEDIALGDEVMTASGKPEQVIKRMRPKKNTVFMLKTDKGFTTKTTATQPIMLANGYYKDVIHLRPGMELKGVGKLTERKGIGTFTVYDIQTTGENTYIADGFIAEGGGNHYWHDDKVAG